ncbi:MAG: DUF1570 domain-containing protein [Planctomycetaceae bacterium]
MALAAAMIAASAAQADTFHYIDRDGNRQTVEARLAGSGQHALLLFKADGQALVIPEQVVEKREPADGPAPLTPAEMVDTLKSRFGGDLLRTLVGRRHVTGFIAAGPLDRKAETRVRGLLQKVNRFLDSVDSVFERFAREMQFPLHDPEYPLVTVVFESDADFNKFADENTRGAGLSAHRIAGFYAPATNWLAIRLEECRTYRVPLHEAIHQQVYNRVFQRYAPIPTWFDEGIATGFENNGEKVDIHPAKINGHYAWLAKSMPAGELAWNDIVSDDASFVGDILANEAYVEAWSLHWMLVTQHKDAYRKYVQELAARTPLEDLPAEHRAERFTAIFGQSVDQIARQFPRVLEVGMQRQRVPPPESPPVGVSITDDDLAEVHMSAEIDVVSGQMRVEGELRNASPIRPLTFHVAVVTTSGAYTDWVVEAVDLNASVPLSTRLVSKVLPGTRGGPAEKFGVRVQWVLPGSEQAQEWARHPPAPEGL